MNAKNYCKTVHEFRVSLFWEDGSPAWKLMSLISDYLLSTIKSLIIQHIFSQFLANSDHLPKNWIGNLVGWGISFYEMKTGGWKKVNTDSFPI